MMRALLALLLMPLGLLVACEQDKKPAPATTVTTATTTRAAPTPPPEPSVRQEEAPLPWRGMDAAALRGALSEPVTAADVEALEAAALALSERPEAQVLRAWHQELVASARGQKAEGGGVRRVPGSKARQAAQQALRQHHDEVLVPAQPGGAQGHARRVARVYGLLAAAERMKIGDLSSDRSAEKLAAERARWRERWEEHQERGGQGASMVRSQVERFAPMAALVLMPSDTTATWEALGPEGRQRLLASFHTLELLRGVDERGALGRAVPAAMVEVSR